MARPSAALAETMQARAPATPAGGSGGGGSPSSRAVSARRRHASCICFMRSSARTRADRVASSTGLERKSSAPASRPRTRSVGSVSAVTMMIGM